MIQLIKLLITFKSKYNSNYKKIKIIFNNSKAFRFNKEKKLNKELMMKFLSLVIMMKVLMNNNNKVKNILEILIKKIVFKKY